ncbi:hypothetical protein [Streptomyces sp. CB03911]|uniref:hypothetical protein n=1 Tax=Streptomyces sp. CB03911 TaxID=1804758 RepID=UPI00093B283D|nr:hypothetical protein [Streptomyces sp. CB03911]OKI14244.1 hypothetical protein A6A07_13925 [Streptomyces sp. CB03911]
MTDDPDPEALRAAADHRVRQRIAEAGNRRRRRATTRAALNTARAAGLTARHHNRLDYLTNRTLAATAA